MTVRWIGIRPVDPETAKDVLLAHAGARAGYSGERLIYDLVDGRAVLERAADRENR